MQQSSPGIQPGLLNLLVFELVSEHERLKVAFNAS